MCIHAYSGERVIKATAFFFIDLSLNNIPNYIMQVRIVMQVRVVVLLQNAHRRMRMATKGEQLDCKKINCTTAGERMARLCHSTASQQEREWLDCTTAGERMARLPTAGERMTRLPTAGETKLQNKE